MPLTLTSPWPLIPSYSHYLLFPTCICQIFQADRIYKSGNQLQLRCLLLAKACLGYPGICHRVYTHTNAAQTPWRIYQHLQQLGSHADYLRAYKVPQFKINTSLLTLYLDLSPRSWALPRRQTERLSWAERWACGQGVGLEVDTAGTGPCSPPSFSSMTLNKLLIPLGLSFLIFKMGCGSLRTPFL